MPKTPDEMRQVGKDAEAKIVDLKFTDLPGVWQHFSIPIEDLNDELFEEGIGFDRSSIRGFQSIHERDMLLVADAETACLDPVLDVPTLNLICNVLDPVTRQRYSRDTNCRTSARVRRLRAGICCSPFMPTLQHGFHSSDRCVAPTLTINSLQEDSGNQPTRPRSHSIPKLGWDRVSNARAGRDRVAQTPSRRRRSPIKAIIYKASIGLLPCTSKTGCEALSSPHQEEG